MAWRAGHHGGVIRVCIIARNARLAEEIRAALALEEAIEIVETRISPRFVPPARQDCDVVLLLALPESEILDGPPAVALTDSPWSVFPGPHSPHAVLPVAARTEEITAALLAAGSGLLVLTADQAATLARHPPATLESLSVTQEKLTARELEVLRMLAGGLSNKEIAVALRVSDHTVKFHVSQILAKLDASSRTEAVTAGIRAGLLFI